MSTILKPLLFLFAINLASCSSDLSSIMPPEGLTVTWPADGGFVNRTLMTMTGECKAGTLVTISGDIVGDVSGDTATVICSSKSKFSTVLVLTSGEGVKVISVIQTADDNTSSEPEIINVTLDTSAPGAPTISSPAANQMLNQFSQSISGTCEAGSTVRVTGNVVSGPRTGPCIGGSYSVSVTFTNSERNKDFAVTQIDRAGNLSAATSRRVVIDTTAPAAPIYTNPTGNIFSNSTSHTIAGTCEANAIILISGSIVNAPVEVTCTAAKTFSRNVSLVAGQGAKSIGISQRDLADNYSVTVGRTITFDSINPDPPVLLTPSAGAKVTTRNIILTGRCEAAAAVTIAGAGVATPVTVNCSSTGTFSRAITLTTGNGAKAISVTQRDRATNVSMAATRSLTLNLPSGMTSSGIRNISAHDKNSHDESFLQNGYDLKTVYDSLAHTVRKQNSKCLSKALNQNSNGHVSDVFILDLTQRILEGEFSGVEMSNEEIMKSIIDEDGQLTSLSEYYLSLMEKECQY